MSTTHVDEGGIVGRSAGGVYQHGCRLRQVASLIGQSGYDLAERYAKECRTVADSLDCFPSRGAELVGLGRTLRTEAPITQKSFVLRPTLVGMRADLQSLTGLTLSCTGGDSFVD